MLSRRCTIAVPDPRSGVERRVTISLLLALVAFVAVVVLPILLGFRVAWTATIEAQRLSARNRALEIETANYRAATEALVKQLESLRLSSGAGRHLSQSFTSARQDPATDTSITRDNPTSPRRFSPVAVATSGTADVQHASGSAELATVMRVLEGVRRMRAAAEEADAPLLASTSYQAGIALELEALHLSVAGRPPDALARAVAADTRFRAAEIEARAEAATREGLRRVDAPAHAGAVETRETSAGRTDEDMIRSAIAQYVSGLESRNLAALKRVWPTLDGHQERAIRTEFENARTVQARFTNPRITTVDDVTTVTGLRTYRVETHDGHELSTLTRSTITLRRSGDAWVIERIVHHHQ